MEIKHIQDHLMSVEEGYVRCFLIEGENAALVIDGGVEAGLREMVEKQTSKPLTFLLTHSDPDHTAACGDLRKFWCILPKWPGWRRSGKPKAGLLPCRKGIGLILSLIILRWC